MNILIYKTFVFLTSLNVQKQSFTNVQQIDFLKNITKFIGKHLCRTFFLMKLQALDMQLHEKGLREMFSCDDYAIFQKSIFLEHL